VSRASPSTNAVAARSLSRKLLHRFLSLQPDWARPALASALSIPESRLSEYEWGQRLMPLDVQGRLAAFVLAHEPALCQLANRLRLQVEAARRYEAGDVVRHLTYPR